MAPDETNLSKRRIMTASFKPEAYSTVSPYLVVQGASRSIEFLVEVFDAAELLRVEGEEGRVMHAELRIGDTVVMIADGVEDWPPVAGHVHVYVPDVNVTFQRALDAGGVTVQEPVRKDDPDRRGGVRDPGGTTWWIATREG